MEIRVSLILQENISCFAQLKRQNHSISVAEISKELSQNFALFDMAPNFASALKHVLFLPSGHFLRFVG